MICKLIIPIVVSPRMLNLTAMPPIPCSDDHCRAVQLVAEISIRGKPIPANKIRTTVVFWLLVCVA